LDDNYIGNFNEIFPGKFYFCKKIIEKYLLKKVKNMNWNILKQMIKIVLLFV